MDLDLSKDMFEGIPESKDESRIRVEIYKNKNLIFSENFDYDEITIGRKSVNNNPDIDLIPFDTDRVLSRQTLVINKENEEYYLKNTSKQKIYVNKEKIEPQERTSMRTINRVILPNKIGMKIIVLSENEEKMPEETNLNKKSIKGEMILFDTNALIEHLDLLDEIKNNEIIMPAMVLEELDHLSHRNKVQEQARRALKKSINMIASNKIKEPVLSKLSIMPEEYQDSRSNDNLILAIAYEHQDKKKVNLITSDNYLIQKAKTLGIKAYKPEEIKGMIL
jgi:rRNA-processing protein FCF1